MIKKTFFILAAFLFIFSFNCFSADPVPESSGQDKLAITLFTSPRCKKCLDLKEDFLPTLKEKYKHIDSLEWVEVDISEEDNLKLLLSINSQLGQEGAFVPAVLIDKLFLVGKQAIIDSLEDVIQVSLNTKTSQLDFKEVDMVFIFKKISALSIAGAGLLDGVNPCAFAVIIFFISFLAVYGYRKKEIICVGSSYCLAVFITYFLIGLGFFKFLYAIANIHFLIKFFYYLVAILCFVLSALAFYDYFKFKKTKKPGDLVLQLPKFLKKRIHLVIGSRLRDSSSKGDQRKQRRGFDLIASSFVVGVLVSLLEAACTGQVYVPVIVSILKYPHLRAKALLYLFIYNLMFIFPLLVIFILALFGVGSEKLNLFLKRHLGKIKILMAILFLILGVFVLGYEQIYSFVESAFIKWFR